ncbi:hypothetical protein [Paenibacillus sp. MMO-177]|uniref:hypothetical protein n=1 Tax=Paenibacillus sp. MMO-177 TaxID=3081289 RepID=UPI003017305E
MKAILQLILHQEEEGTLLHESNAWRLQCGKTKVKLSNGLSGTILRKSACYFKLDNGYAGHVREVTYWSNATAG